MTFTTQSKTREADTEYGYAFGVDGLVSVSDACETLGITRNTLDRLCSRGRLRRGKDRDTGRVSICKRSLTEYVQELEI